MFSQYTKLAQDELFLNSLQEEGSKASTTLSSLLAAENLMLTVEIEISQSQSAATRIF